MQQIEDRVRRVVSTTLGDLVGVNLVGVNLVGVDRMDLSADLFGAGMTWPQTVQVMLSLEDEFDVVFPVDAVVRATFATLRSIIEAVAELSDRPAVARSRPLTERTRTLSARSMR